MLFLFSIPFFLGAIVGSFLHVVSIRFHTGKSLRGRSQCFSCGAQLRWYELIPLFSYLIQKGRCRRCGSRIPREVFLAEVLTAVVFLGITARFLFSRTYTLPLSPYLISTFYLYIVFSLLIIIFFYDLRHKIIPNELTYTLTLLTFVGMFFFSFQGGTLLTYTGFHYPPLADIVGALLIPGVFVAVWYLSRGRLMGLGDPKLMLPLVLLLGWEHGLSSIILSFWIGSVTVFTLFLTSLLRKHFRHSLLPFSKRGILQTEIPFAPFLIIAAFFTVVTGWSLFQFVW